MSNRLTLNMGVRWECDGMLADKYGNLSTTWSSNLVPNSQVPTTPKGSVAALQRLGGSEQLRLLTTASPRPACTISPLSVPLAGIRR